MCGLFLPSVAVVLFAFVIFDFLDFFFSVYDSFFGAFFFSYALCAPIAGA